MAKHKGKDYANFKSIYGNSLILNMSKSNGCLEVSIKTEKNAFSHKTTLSVGFICVISLLKCSLDIKICVIITGLLCICYVLYEAFFFIKEENVLIVKGFGCHISKKHWFGEKTTFIPYEQIQQVFINEVIFGRRIIYLLTLLTKEYTKENEHKLIPLFLNLLPRIDCLQIIYKGMNNLDSR